MGVILKEDVAKLGTRCDVVKVAEGYGRNFLLPTKLAIEATSANKTVIEQMKAASVRRSAKEKTEAQALAKQFDGLEVKFLRKSGEGDHLFGSVTAGDNAGPLGEKCFHTARGTIQCDEPLTPVGEFPTAVRLPKDVTIHLNVGVVMHRHAPLVFTRRRNVEGWRVSIRDVMRLIKGRSAHFINRFLNRHGPVWQEESFDHVLR